MVLVIGADILCKNPAEEQTQDNFNCFISGWLSLFSLCGTSMCLNILAFNLIEHYMF
eukprot:UN04963